MEVMNFGEALYNKFKKELVNLQNVKGQVKRYQIKQVMQLVERYNLELEERK
jgi:hypothetical protein